MAAVLLWANDGVAQHQRLAVVELDAEGMTRATAAEAHELVWHAVVAPANAKGYAVLPNRTVRAAMERLECRGLTTCRVALADDLAVQRFLIGNIREQEGLRSARLDLVDAVSGQVLRSRSLSGHSPDGWRIHLAALAQDVVDEAEPDIPVGPGIGARCGCVGPGGHPAKTQVKGGLTTEEVGRAMRTRLPHIKACFTEEARRAPGLKGGLARVHFLIGGDGRVSAAEMERSDLPAKVDACIIRRVRATRFPPPRRPGVEVHFPFVLMPPPEVR
ncbi:MAG: AgmX/PglI C-terminal domain-containing protein [Myxococcota bacterium]